MREVLEVNIQRISGLVKIIKRDQRFDPIGAPGPVKLDEHRRRVVFAPFWGLVLIF